MDESTMQLQRELASEREQLNDNLRVLETKTRALTDWRSQFQKQPLLMLGLAFGGGMIMSNLLGGGRRAAPAVDPTDGRGRPAWMPRPPANGSWNRVRDSLSAVATNAAVELLQGVVPGFKEHFDRGRGHVDNATDGRTSSVRATQGVGEARSNGRPYNAPDAA
jgi:hypothetical protein